jgi:hypothetical protein
MGLDINLYSVSRETVGQLGICNFPTPKGAKMLENIRSCRTLLVFLRAFSVMHGNNPSIYAFNDVNIKFSYGMYEMFEALKADDESLSALATLDFGSYSQKHKPTFWDATFFRQQGKMTDSKLFGSEWDKEEMGDLLNLLCNAYSRAITEEKLLFFNVSH